MRMEISAFLKFGLYAAAVLLSSDILCTWYIRQRNRLTHRPIHEVFFMMSNDTYCCSRVGLSGPSKEDIKMINNCQNSHCKAKLSLKIVQHMDSAKHLICIAIYMFTNKYFANAVLNAKRRGVKIRIVSDQSMIASSGSRVNELQAAGIPIRIAGDGDKYMHNKFCLIDVLDNEKAFNENEHPQKGVLINGSMNWTSNGLDRNWENVIFTSDDHLKTEFKKAFDHMWTKLA